MSKLTCATINKELKKLGYAERLVKGSGYMYFMEGDANGWKQTAVYVTSANDLSLEQWLFEYRSLKGDDE